MGKQQEGVHTFWTPSFLFYKMNLIFHSIVMLNVFQHLSGKIDPEINSG